MLYPIGRGALWVCWVRTQQNLVLKLYALIKMYTDVQSFPWAQQYGNKPLKNSDLCSFIVHFSIWSNIFFFSLSNQYFLWFMHTVLYLIPFPCGLLLIWNMLSKDPLEEGKKNNCEVIVVLHKDSYIYTSKKTVTFHENMLSRILLVDILGYWKV